MGVQGELAYRRAVEGVQGELPRSTTNLIPAYRRVGLVVCEKKRSWKYDNQYSPNRKDPEPGAGNNGW